LSQVNIFLVFQVPSALRALCLLWSPAMTSSPCLALAVLLSTTTLGWADSPASVPFGEIAWGDVGPDGSLENRALDVPVANARGAENLFIANPMDSHDWTHTSTVRSSMLSHFKAATASSDKVAALEESLRPIFLALPKTADGQLSKGTARYALHRFFSEKHGWSIKGLQPAGAGWTSTLSVTPDVRDVSKYMMPTYLQELVLTHLGASSFNLRSLAVLAATIEHLVNAETLSIVYSTFATLGLPIPGKRSEKEVDEILNTFLMVYAFGVNLDVSVLEDVRQAEAYLEKSHSSWPQLQAFAQEVKRSTWSAKELNFDEIVQVVRNMGERYVGHQGKDCARVKDELVQKPSHHQGRVLLSEVQPSSASGRRQLFTESPEVLQKFGVLSADAEAKLIIPNYVNSQSMCLSTASFYAACCVNECEGLLGRLEREVRAPAVAAAELGRLVATLPGAGLAETLLQELPGLADPSSGMVALHSRAFAEWMHRAFPLECPAPHTQKVTNPKTPDEWMGESGLVVADLEEMMDEIKNSLAQYTTMGKANQDVFVGDDAVSDPSVDIVVVHSASQMQMFKQSQQKPAQRSFLAMAFFFTATVSMVIFGVRSARSGLAVMIDPKAKVLQDLDSHFKQFV